MSELQQQWVVELESREAQKQGLLLGYHSSSVKQGIVLDYGVQKMCEDLTFWHTCGTLCHGLYRLGAYERQNHAICTISSNEYQLFESAICDDPFICAPCLQIIELSCLWHCQCFISIQLYGFIDLRVGFSHTSMFFLSLPSTTRVGLVVKSWAHNGKVLGSSPLKPLQEGHLCSLGCSRWLCLLPLVLL